MTSVGARFKARLLAREPLLGVFVKTPHPAIVEVLAGAGLDCVCLDAEHAPFDRGDLDRCILAAIAHGLPVLVRVPSGAPHEILNALDLGACGVVIPHVCNVQDADRAGRTAHFGAGGRGYAGGTRAAGFTAPPIGERLAATRSSTSVIVQIEDAEALAHVEAISAAPGVDAVFIGRIDLTVALAQTDPKSAPVIACVDDICRRSLASGAVVGMFTPDLSEVPGWLAKGSTLFLLGSDQGFVRAGAQRLRIDAGLA